MERKDKKLIFRKNSPYHNTDEPLFTEINYADAEPVAEQSTDPVRIEEPRTMQVTEVDKLVVGDFYKVIYHYKSKKSESTVPKTELAVLNAGCS